MIIYHPDLSSKFEEFSLPIPVRDDRSERVAQTLGMEILHIPSDIALLKREDLLRAHDEEFIDGLYSKELYQYMYDCFEFAKYTPRKCSFNLKSFLDHIVFQVSASFYSMEMALDEGFVFHLGGGMHHAHSNQGRGFCLLNDIVIGIRKLQAQGKIQKALVVDVDAHKGDGTAQITKDDESIETLSIHMADGWPLDDLNKQAPWFIPSTVDIPIMAGEEGNYLSQLKSGLEVLSDEADLVVVVDGSDPYEKDQLESSALLKLTKEQMLERDLLIYDYFKKKNIPQLYLTAGGYGEFSWEIYYQFLKKVLEKTL